MGKHQQTILWLVATLLIVSFLGFRKTYFGQFPHFEDTTWVVHFHVFSILCWFSILVAQASLAKSGRLDLHRQIGRFSFILVPLILVGFALVTHQGQMRHKQPDLFGATLFDAGLFLLFYALAMANRRNPAHHARYMILSAVPFLNPGLGRFIGPEVSVPVEFLLILTLLLTAYFRKQPYRPYLVGLGCMVLLLSGIVYVSVIEPSVMEWIWAAIWG